MRSPEAYPNQRATILADLAAQTDVSGLHAEVMAELQRLPADGPALGWSEWLRKSAGWQTHYFFPGILGWRPTLLALAGEPVIEAVAITLFEG